MTLPIGTRASKPPGRAPAFTLVELIVVMALLALATAFAAPSLARSLRDRNLAQEAARFIAATEYARNEAVSQGVPTAVWIDAQARRYGVGPKTGFEGAENRERDFELQPDVNLEFEAPVTAGTVAEVVEFEPDGALTANSLETLTISDRFGASLTVVRTKDRWSYMIQRETP